MSNQERKEALKKSLEKDIYEKAEKIDINKGSKYDDLMTDKLSKILPTKEEKEEENNTVEFLVDEEVEFEIDDDKLLKEYDNFINDASKTLNNVNVEEIEKEITQEIEDIKNGVVAAETTINIEKNTKPEKVIDENTPTSTVDFKIDETTTINLEEEGFDLPKENIEEDKKKISKKEKAEKKELKEQLKKEKEIKKSEKKEIKKAQKDAQKSGSIVIDVLLVLAIVLLIALIIYLR